MTATQIKAGIIIVLTGVVGYLIALLVITLGIQSPIDFMGAKEITIIRLATYGGLGVGAMIAYTIHTLTRQR